VSKNPEISAKTINLIKLEISEMWKHKLMFVPVSIKILKEQSHISYQHPPHLKIKPMWVTFDLRWFLLYLF